MSDINNEPIVTKSDSCPTIGYQEVSVCVPVEVKPYAEIGEIETICLGESIVVSGGECKGKPKDSTCKFTITQKIQVAVPVTFGAETEVGEAGIDCLCADNEPCSE